MDILKKLAKALNVPFDYLIEGVFEADDNRLESLPPSDADELLESYSRLSPEDKKFVQNMLRRLANNDNPRIIGDQ